MKNLWPTVFTGAETAPPHALLEEQAKLLSSATGQYVTAEVLPMDVAAVANLFGDNFIFGYSFFLIGPYLSNFKYRAFMFAHGIPMYPVKIRPEEQLADEIGLKIIPHKLQSYEEFESCIEKILQSDRMKSIIGTIISLSKAAPL